MYSTKQQGGSNHFGVETDGVVDNEAKEPPGQFSVYIPPGDLYSERYRQSTFARFPSKSPAYVIDLAASGFHYTGYRDRVKCFSCGISVEDWRVGDDGSDQRWHKNDCSLLNGTDQLNVPTYSSTRRKLVKRVLYSTQNSLTAQPNIPFSASMNQAYPNSPSSSHIQNEKQNCEMPLRMANILSQEHQNLIFTMNLAMEKDRRKTFQKWPSNFAPNLPAILAEEGFFYLGNLDRVQCFSCSGVLRNWTADDDVREQHTKHFSQCRIVRGVESRNIKMSMEEKRAYGEGYQLLSHPPREDSIIEPPDPSPDENMQLELLFPLQHPMNPHMRSEEYRVQTFDSKWPPYRIKATKQQIAKAGFFFLGTSDKAKCWYCNGGLQNWEEDDEPWTEHAKWFPRCEWVLRKKGVNFVRRIVDENPNLHRLPIRNSVPYTLSPNPCHVNGILYGPPVAAVLAAKQSVENNFTEGNKEENGLDEAAERLKALQVSNLCKKCSNVPADALFRPCGHLIYCMRCAEGTRKCSICEQNITIRKVYFA